MVPLLRLCVYGSFITSIVFIVMKFTGYVDWSWLFTLSPIACTVVLNIITMKVYRRQNPTAADRFMENMK